MDSMTEAHKQALKIGQQAEDHLEGHNRTYQIEYTSFILGYLQQRHKTLMENR